MTSLVGFQCFDLPSVQHCQLSDKQGIWPVKTSATNPQKFCCRTCGRREMRGTG